jgi:tRNA(adenine34) deaminase
MHNAYMKSRDEEFMRRAISEARKAKNGGDMPFGAVIASGGKILVAAGNSEHLDQDVTQHAEVKAIREASRLLGRRDLSDCTIYSTMEPCPMCTGAILHSCISRIVYALSRDDLPHLFRTRNIRLHHLALDSHHIPKLEGGILRESAAEVFHGYSEAFRVQPQLTDQLG